MLRMLQLTKTTTSQADRPGENEPMKIQLKLATSPNIDPVTVRADQPASQTGRANVLAVHPRLAKGGCKAANGWSVTHIATGRGVGVVLTTKARAMELAREFGERPEWAMVGARGGVSRVDPHFAREFQGRARDIAGIIPR